MQTDETLFLVLQIVILIYSIVLHEVAHGLSAYYFKDKTAYYFGRLTLNPIKHVDLVGSVIVPTMLVLSGSGLLAGWAKPVPVNESNLKPQKIGSFVTSAAGLIVNLLLALIFIGIGQNVEDIFIKNIMYIGAVTNAALLLFNLIPFPPSDGFRLISHFLPQNLYNRINYYVENNLMLMLLVGIVLATQIFTIFFPAVRNIIYLNIF